MSDQRNPHMRFGTSKAVEPTGLSNDGGSAGADGRRRGPSDEARRRGAAAAGWRHRAIRGRCPSRRPPVETMLAQALDQTAPTGLLLGGLVCQPKLDGYHDLPPRAWRHAVRFIRHRESMATRTASLGRAPYRPPADRNGQNASC